MTPAPGREPVVLSAGVADMIGGGNEGAGRGIGDRPHYGPVPPPLLTGPVLGDEALDTHSGLPVGHAEESGDGLRVSAEQ